MKKIFMGISIGLLMFMGLTVQAEAGVDQDKIELGDKATGITKSSKWEPATVYKEPDGAKTGRELQRGTAWRAFFKYITASGKCYYQVAPEQWLMEDEFELIDGAWDIVPTQPETAISLEKQDVPVYRTPGGEQTGRILKVGTAWKAFFTAISSDRKEFYHQVAPDQWLRESDVKGETQQDSQTLSEEVIAAKIFALVNQVRTNNNVQALVKDPILEKASSIRKTELKTAFSHTRPNGTSWSTALPEAGLSVSTSSLHLGENLAYFYSSKAPSSNEEAANKLYQLWEDSPGHYNNMIRDVYSRIGIGVYLKDGYVYGVQIFSSDF